MCDPVTATIAIGFAVSAAGTAASAYGSQQNASAQASYENDLYTKTVKAANTDYANQSAQEQARIGQVEDATRQQSQSNNIAGAQNVGQIVNQEAAHGVTGNSVQALTEDFERITQSNNQTLAINLAQQKQQSEQNMLAYAAQAQSRIAGATPAPVVFPNMTAAALQLGATGLQAYDEAQFANGSGIYDPNSGSKLTSPVLAGKIPKISST